MTALFFSNKKIPTQCLKRNSRDDAEVPFYTNFSSSAIFSASFLPRVFTR